MKIQYKLGLKKLYLLSITVTIYLLAISCLDNKHSTIEKPLINQDENPLSTIEKERITWHEIKLNNITFSLPSNIQNNENLSNNQRKVYIANDETIGITIDFAPLPPDQSGSEISKIISDISSFGQSINEDNRRIFDDFRLINTYYSILGFKESIEVHQISTKISGQDIEMNVKANFIIASPNYYSITFTYPRSSISDEKIVEDIKKSFRFKTENKNSSNELADFLEKEITNKNSSENNIVSHKDVLHKRYLGKHLFNAYFIDEFNTFGIVEITQDGNNYKIKGGQKNNKNEYVLIDGIIETFSLDNFTFIGSISTYNPTSVKSHNMHRQPHNLLDNECIWNGKATFERIVENRKYWRMRGKTGCETHTGTIDIFFD